MACPGGCCPFYEAQLFEFLAFSFGHLLVLQVHSRMAYFRWICIFIELEWKTDKELLIFPEWMVAFEKQIGVLIQE